MKKGEHIVGVSERACHEIGRSGAAVTFVAAGPAPWMVIVLKPSCLITAARAINSSYSILSYRTYREGLSFGQVWLDRR